MNSPFPFGFPSATAFYLVVYLASLILHVVFMNYVLAGSCYLASAYLQSFGKASRLKENRIAMILRDWLPFFLSAAITAGVAPLLFIQILYKEPFYTANLLLFHRWMVIVPVLIIGFYLLYVLKSRWLESQTRPAQVLAAAAAFACFLFTAFSWTENHVLSRQGISLWSVFYEKGYWIYRNPEIFPRLAMWVAGSFTTLSMLLGWQLWWKNHFNREDVKESLDQVCKMAVIAVMVATILGLFYFSKVPPEVAATLREPIAQPYVYALAAGLLIFAGSWLLLLKRRVKIPIFLMVIQTMALLTSMISVSVLRECIRIRSIGIEAFYRQHEDAARVGGFGAFLTFTVLNVLAIAICVIAVKRHQISTRTPRRTF